MMRKGTGTAVRTKTGYTTDKIMNYRIDDAVMNPETKVITWKSNGRHPMDDMTTDWYNLGIITEAEKAATDAARKIMDDVFVNEWKASRNNRTAEEIAEERFEMRAAFGPGETVVNVITGERTLHQTGERTVL
jgi:RNA polymerase subunit RPABC4/transcription elongation factor Spt4